MLRGRALLMAFVVLALLSTSVFSDSGTTYPLQVHCLINPQSLTDIGTCVSESVAISAIGLLVSLAVVALTYMIGEVLNMGGLKGWYRKELWETAKSLMLVAIIYSVLVLLGSLGSSLAVTSTAAGSALSGAATQQCSTAGTFSTAASPGLASNLVTLYNTAITGYLKPTLCYANNAFAAVFGLSVGIRTARTLSIETWFAIPLLPPPFVPLFGSLQSGSTAQIFVSSYVEGIDPTIPTFSFLVSLIKLLVVPVMVLLQFQVDLLPSIVMAGLGVFLPIGIILRSIPFLRGIGGTMIAIAIGLSIIYPIMLVTLNLPITDYFIGLSTGTMSAPIACPGGGLVCSLLSIVPTYTTKWPLDIALGSGNYDTKIANLATSMGFFDFSTNLSSLYPAMNLVNQYALIMVLQFVLFPVDMVLGIIFVQTIAKSLGGALKLSIGKRIKVA